MQPIQKLLYAPFPRSVAASGVRHPSQFFVHSEGEFDAFWDATGTRKNTYASVSYFPPKRPVVTDKVSFDLDSPMKEAAFPSDINDQEKIDSMRDDPDVADDVLAPVCEDARVLASEAMEYDIPVVGVFSGMGLHVHLLFNKTKAAEDKFKSTIYRYAEELDLSTVDRQAKDTSRILRIPNGRRVDSESGEPIICDIYTVPIPGRELIDIDPSELLRMSTEPRQLDPETIEGERQPMPLYDEYTDERAAEVDSKDLGEQADIADKEAEFMLDNRAKLPCIAKRAKQRNPEHYVRFSLAVSLFNMGYTVNEATDFIESLRWVDYDREKTKKYLRQIYESGYSRPSCQTMMSQGYCVYDDEPTKCEAYGTPAERCKWID